MPNPLQVASVSAGGQTYDIWTEIEVTRSCVDIIDHALLTVAEISPKTKQAISSLKLTVGDQVTVSLAGQKVITGIVYMRQGILDEEHHQVQIGICSSAQSVMASTVDGKPGQYENMTLQQIGSAVFGKVGVNFTVQASGDQPFPRVSEAIGESRYTFVESLCRMQNMHMIDDGNGGIIAFRGATDGKTLIQEGVNLKSGRILLKIDEHVDNIAVMGHDQGNDSADMNRSPTASTTSDPPIGRPLSIIAEHLGNQSFMQKRANHQADWDKLQQVDGDVVVSGWFAPDGQLWWSKVTNLITVRSPSLLPADTFTFMIKGVVHRQSAEDGNGTITHVLLCRQDGYGSGMAAPLVTN